MWLIRGTFINVLWKVGEWHLSRSESNPNGYRIVVSKLGVYGSITEYRIPLKTFSFKWKGVERLTEKVVYTEPLM